MWIVNWLRSLNWRIITMAVFAIGVLHIVATLAAPALVIDPAYDRLAKDLPLNQMQILAPVTPASQPLPFLSPDARYAACRFDTADGAVEITANLPEPGWVLALYSERGENFFSSVASPDAPLDVSLLLVPSEERFLPPVPGLGPQMPSEQKTLTVAAQKGIAVLHAPSQGQSYNARNLAQLKRARCAFRKT